MTRAGNTIVVTLGALSGTTDTANSPAAMSWAPSALATDRAGNTMSTTAVAQTGAAAKDF
jgi:hypothetical protein